MKQLSTVHALRAGLVRKRGRFYCTCALRMFVSQKHCTSVVQCIVYRDGVAGADVCFLKEYGEAVDADSFPSGLLVARC